LFGFPSGWRAAISCGKEFYVEIPIFNEKEAKFFNYKIDSLVQFEERWLYSISFDQKPGVKLLRRDYWLTQIIML
jgi:hypothetical protein